MLEGAYAEGHAWIKSRVFQVVSHKLMHTLVHPCSYNLPRLFKPVHRLALTLARNPAKTTSYCKVLAPSISHFIKNLAMTGYENKNSAGEEVVGEHELLMIW